VVGFNLLTNGVCLKWKSVAGKSYRMERTALNKDGWTDVSGPIKASGATTSWICPFSEGAPQGFYRIVELPN